MQRAAGVAADGRPGLRGGGVLSQDTLAEIGNLLRIAQRHQPRNGVALLLGAGLAHRVHHLAAGRQHGAKRGLAPEVQRFQLRVLAGGDPLRGIGALRDALVGLAELAVARHAVGNVLRRPGAKHRRHLLRVPVLRRADGLLQLVQVIGLGAELALQIGVRALAQPDAYDRRRRGEDVAQILRVDGVLALVEHRLALIERFLLGAVEGKPGVGGLDAGYVGRQLVIHQRTGLAQYTGPIAIAGPVGHRDHTVDVVTRLQPGLRRQVRQVLRSRQRQGVAYAAHVDPRRSPERVECRQRGIGALRMHGGPLQGRAVVVGIDVLSVAINALLKLADPRRRAQRRGAVGLQPRHRAGVAIAQRVDQRGAVVADTLDRGLRGGLHRGPGIGQHGVGAEPVEVLQAGGVRGTGL